jgi:hypothetical protein
VIGAAGAKIGFCSVTPVISRQGPTKANEAGGDAIGPTLKKGIWMKSTPV